MLRTMCQGKIHRATVTETNIDYVGSITLDQDLMDAAGMMEYEKVQVVDVTNGARLETYTIVGPRKSGVVCLNGAAAHLIHQGDLVIVMSFGLYTEEELAHFQPKIVLVDKHNAITDTISNREVHGQTYQQLTR